MTPWKTDRWFTSPWNFTDEARESLHFAPQIQLHDVTLRDGEQQAGLLFTKDQKIALAEKLAEVGVARIEAGMPAVSKEDAAAVAEIARRNLGPDIYAFARCTKGDIDLAVDCGCKGVVTEIPCSEHMIEKAYRWPLEKAIQQSIDVTAYAHEKGLRVVFFTIDATRANPAWYLETVARIAREGHMDALTIADTMGVLNPQGAYAMVRAVKDVIKVPIEVHFHDDFGMGAASTIAGLAAGADVAHTSITGIGERSGNVAYEDVALSLLCTYGIDLGLDLSKLRETSKLMQKFAGISLRPNRPIVGDTVFDLESGIVTSWWKNCFPQEQTELGPYVPSLVGQKPINIVMGKLSGVPNVEIWMERLGYPKPDKEEAKRILELAKNKAFELGRNLTEEEFSALLE